MAGHLLGFCRCPRGGQVPDGGCISRDRWKRSALLRGCGRVEPYEPHGVCLVEFGDGVS
jgi:hypothetical protein